MNKFLTAFAADESGVTAMEYGMIAALIAVVIITALGLLGGQLNKTFTTIKDALANANEKAPSKEGCVIVCDEGPRRSTSALPPWTKLLRSFRVDLCAIDTFVSQASASPGRFLVSESLSRKFKWRISALWLAREAQSRVGTRPAPCVACPDHWRRGRKLKAHLRSSP